MARRRVGRVGHEQVVAALEQREQCGRHRGEAGRQQHRPIARPRASRSPPRARTSLAYRAGRSARRRSGVSARATPPTPRRWETGSSTRDTPAGSRRPADRPGARRRASSSVSRRNRRSSSGDGFFKGCLRGGVLGASLNDTLVFQAPPVARSPREALGQKLARFGEAASANRGVNEQLVEHVALGVTRAYPTDAAPHGHELVDGFGIGATPMRNHCRASGSPTSAITSASVPCPLAANRSHDARKSSTTAPLPAAARAMR